jgi:D-tyrosyl-tRNA(Tyr) deacylase
MTWLAELVESIGVPVGVATAIGGFGGALLVNLVTKGFNKKVVNIGNNFATATSVLNVASTKLAQAQQLLEHATDIATKTSDAVNGVLDRVEKIESLITDEVVALRRELLATQKQLAVYVANIMEGEPHEENKSI